ncbi:MAG: YHS domain-containing (seleno)protein [Hyphomicrobium sp.]|nr:YHS domain-containing (seleno)protein [Hyphomicrobium sp.]
MQTSRILLIILAILITGSAIAWLAKSSFAAKDPIFAGLVQGVAVGGYDPVAYFEKGSAIAGDPAITLEHSGATWRFQSEANRQAFKADPDRYAPQYGGYCAYAVANGYTAKGDPEAWKIVDGKLYLNYDKSVQAEWAKDIPGYVAKGDANWPRVLGK